MTPEEFRRYGHQLVDWLAEYHAGLADRPVMPPTQPGEIRAALPASPPDAPEPFDAVLADLDRVVVPGLDVCYAMYKTLFRMAYPFSYDLEDLARYYLAYARLLQHWRKQLGTRLIEIDYEELVADQESVTRRLLDACSLPWEEACLDFHRNDSPTLTASAAQVRRPLYASSVGLWRRYEAQLQPLARALRAGGVAVP